MTTRHDYRIGWICALPLELAAAQAMLDKIHPPLANRPEDRNTYVFGSIGSHNIVVACLPTGVYGTTAATATIVQMRSSYRSIEFCFMVGIGGGAPSPQADIRLGDVVVSAPTIQYGGVIQYDHGKAINGGQFMLTGMLDKPPEELLKTLSRLKAQHILHGNRIQDFYAEALNRYPRLAGEFRFPGQTEDRLFLTEYDHVGDGCDHCDLAMLQCRPPRADSHPHIFYGLIASGNRVLRDAKARDSLSEQYGILCFEMEAAGLMDVFPCLVIRGVCDYSDSHKNKQWQGYAAAMAAAYTKEVTLFLPSHESLCTEDDPIQPVLGPGLKEKYPQKHLMLSHANDAMHRRPASDLPTQQTPSRPGHVSQATPPHSADYIRDAIIPSHPVAARMPLDEPALQMNHKNALEPKLPYIMGSEKSFSGQKQSEKHGSIQVSSPGSSIDTEQGFVPSTPVDHISTITQQRVRLEEIIIQEPNSWNELREALKKSLSLARRHKEWHPWPGDCAEVYHSLRSWMSTPGSSLLALDCESRALSRVRDLVVETIDFLQRTRVKRAYCYDESTGYQVLWTLTSPSNPGESSMGILKSFIQQAIAMDLGVHRPDVLRLFKGSCDEEELWSLLSQTLARITRLFVLVDSRHAGYTMSLLRLAKELVNEPNSSVKFLIVSRGGIDPSSGICRVVRVPTPPPQSRKFRSLPKKDATWNNLVPIF